MLNLLFSFALAHAGDLDNLGKAINEGAIHLGKEIPKEAEKQKNKLLSGAEGSRFFNKEDNNEITVPPADQFWMAIVGDSSVTGAVAGPENWLELTKRLADAIVSHSIPNDSGEPPPLRVMYTETEFKDAKAHDDAVSLVEGSRGSQALDTAQFSFGYILAQKLNVPPGRVVITGQDGKTVSTIGMQFDRIKFTGASTLPPLVLVSYVANDICGPSNFSDPVAKFEAEYTKNLEDQLKYITGGTFKPSAMNGGTRVVFLAPLDIQNILTNKSILDQKVDFVNQGQVTCQQFHSGAIQGGDGAKALQQMLKQECRGILDKFGDPDMMKRVADLQAKQKEITERLVGQYADRLPGLHLEYAKSTNSIMFQEGDVAKDCFHPSRQGATRIADDLLGIELKNVPKL